MMDTTITDGFGLVLPIDKQHVERILHGVKLFELRRKLPRHDFLRVYIYETESAGIVGTFDVADRMEGNPRELWYQVGSAGTTKTRFDAYFRGADKAFALRVANPVRFLTPLRLSELKALEPRWHPRGQLLIAPTAPLARTLERLRVASVGRQVEGVELRPLSTGEEELYAELVTRHIGARYDEIAPAFAEAQLATHALGEDPRGFFTSAKEVHALSAAGTLVGFTTLTFKRGKSVKTGPTVLLDTYRGQGMGVLARRAIEDYALSNGMRKVYCTCPDSSQEVVAYLLRSRYTIEAHLRGQYTASGGELVFGKILKDGMGAWRPISRQPVRARVRQPPFERTDQIERVLYDLLEQTWCRMPRRAVRDAIRGAGVAEGVSYEDKPKDLIVLDAKGKCVGGAFLFLKRGGAVKSLALSRSRDRRALADLLAGVERRAGELDRRKIYFPHPIDDHEVVDFLKDHGYHAEGILRQPYRPNVDVVVLSRFLAQHS